MIWILRNNAAVDFTSTALFVFPHRSTQGRPLQVYLELADDGYHFACDGCVVDDDRIHEFVRRLKPDAAVLLIEMLHGGFVVVISLGHDDLAVVSDILR